VTNPESAPFDADLMAAVRDLGSALRGLVDASVSTTVDAAERVLWPRRRGR
jgi:hypothetical protein